MIVPSLVSAVIPVHNRPQLVREAVESVLSQDWRPLEIIVVDDGSDDETPSVLTALASEHPGIVRIVRRSAPGGPGVAREAGRRELRGEFVQYLDSDDLLAPGKIRRQVEALRASPECDLCWGHEETLYELDGRPARRVPRNAPEVERLFPTLLVEKLWQTFNPLYRRSLVDRMGPWAPLWNAEDWEYDGRAAAAGARPRFVNIVTGSLRRRGHGHVSGGSHMRRRLDSEVLVREAMLRHALACGVGVGDPEMNVFARQLFHLARRCGSAGRAELSRRTFEHARSLASDPDAAPWRLYATTSRRLGWRAAGVLARGFDQLRPLLRQVGACP